MNAHTLAQRAYRDASETTRTPRSIEYEVIARITHRIRMHAKAGPMAYPKLVEALSDNRKLWTTLAVDVADADNGLPEDLRARIFYLAEFVQHQTQLVLARKARISPLLEVNAAILRGLGHSGHKP